ncbi:MAG: hypothetical protein JO218_01785 [Burkholderiales bacterium]|nr:hypothetical protein [Burkholderiales bacterium]
MSGRVSKGISRQRGFALVFTLLFAIAVGLVVLVLFNSGILANTKTQLQNAADAGAYTAAVLQARDANFSAYANRAMVANQVAVAQLVSLNSFLEDAANTQDRMDSWWGMEIDADIFPSSKPWWDAADKVPVSSVQSKFSSLAPTAVSGLDQLIGLLMDAEQANHTSTMLDMLLVINDVVKRNDPNAVVSTDVFMTTEGALALKRWDGSTQQLSANDGSDVSQRFANVVVDRKSTDRFTRIRDSAPTALWASTVKVCIGATASFTAFGFVHEGGTLLSSDLHSWMGLDATQGSGGWGCVYGVCPFCGGPSGFFVDTSWRLPFLGGSGGGLAGKGGYNSEWQGFSGNPTEAMGYGQTIGAGAVLNPLIEAPALYRWQVKGPGSSLDSNGGLQNYYRDVANPIGSTPTDQTPELNGGAYPIAIEVEHLASNLNTSSALAAKSGGTNTAQIIVTPDKLASNTMRALSAGYAFFYRPTSDTGFAGSTWVRKDDGATEVQNLFSPYWQARLTDPSFATKALAVGGQVGP